MPIVCVIRNARNASLDFWISKQDAEKMHRYGLLGMILAYSTWNYATILESDTMSGLYKKLEKVTEKEGM